MSRGIQVAGGEVKLFRLVVEGGVHVAGPECVGVFGRSGARGNHDARS